MARGGRGAIGPALLGVVLAAAGPAGGQTMGGGPALPGEEPALSPAAEKLKALTDPEKAKKKAEDRTRPLYEFYRTQVAPFDVLPFVKEGHWATLSLEMKANYVDFAGVLQTSPVRLLDMPHAVTFRREARLLKEQRGKLGQQIMLPGFQKEIALELTRPGAIRPEGTTLALLRKLEPHQLLIPVLGENAPLYGALSRYQALIPASADREPTVVERQRYFRVVYPTSEPDKPLPLSPHPLTWTTASHVIWDGQDPEGLNINQQQALLDWVHWGGQLIVVGGAGPSLAPLRDSFLGPYLPATPSGADSTLSAGDLLAMSKAHPAPNWPEEGEGGVLRHYLPDDEDNRIRPAPDKGLFLTGLEPMPGATVLPVGDEAGRALGAEWRVGRGRVLVLGVRLTDKVLLDWPGFDTFLRRVVLRRPQEAQQGSRFQVLPAPHLTWLRYAGRDLGLGYVPPPMRVEQANATNYELPLPFDPVCAWQDNAEMPRETRKVLQEASGITIPGSDFVLRVILAYVVALVPVNWFVCRFLLRRRELAWVATPLVALGFALVVERGAAYDLGFDRACDEIDLVEIQGEHPRAHVSRYAALYSTGRHSYTVAYPDDPTALALPMNMANNLAGGETLQSAWQSYPEPALTEFPVQPRSLAMFRAEQVVNLAGGVVLKRDGDKRTVVNGTELELRDAAVVDVAGRVMYPLGTIPAGATAELGEGLPLEEPEDEAGDGEPAKTKAARKGPLRAGIAGNRGTGDPDRWVDPDPFLNRLRKYAWGRPEDRREWRLVAWDPRPHPGQDLRPKVDRHRGLRLVLAHLDYGPPPAFDLERGHEALAPRAAAGEAAAAPAGDAQAEADRP